PPVCRLDRVRDMGRAQGAQARPLRLPDRQAHQSGVRQARPDHPRERDQGDAMADAEMTATYGMTNGALPDEVTLRAAEIANPRFTPRELRLIREHTGVSLSKLLADEDSDDKFVVFGWLKLRRMGYEA